MAREGVIVWGDVSAFDARQGGSYASGSKVIQPVAGAGYMFFAGSNITDLYTAYLPTQAYTMALAGAETFPHLLSVASTFDCPSCVDGMEVPIHQGIFSDSLRRVVYQKVCSIIFRPYQLYSGPQQVLTFVFEKLEMLSAASSITLFDIKNQMLVRVLQGPMRSERFSIQCLAPCNFTIINGATWRQMSEHTKDGTLSGEGVSLFYEVNWSTRRGVATGERVVGHRDCLDYCPASDLQACYQRCLQTRREEQTIYQGDSRTPLRRSSDKHGDQVDAAEGTNLEKNGRHTDGLDSSSRMSKGPQPKASYMPEQVRGNQLEGKRHDTQDVHETVRSSRKLSASASSNKVGSDSGSAEPSAPHLRANNGALVLMQDPVQQLVFGLAATPEVADSCDFSQKPQTLMFPMERVSGEIITPIQGGWVGVCKSSTRCPLDTLCKPAADASLYQSGECQVAVLVNGSTLIKHVWGCPHTPWRQGMSTGVVVSLRTGKQIMFSQTNAAVVTYNEFEIFWTQTSSDKQLDISRWGTYSLGVEMPRTVEVAGTRMHMQFSAPYDGTIPKPAVGRDGTIVAVTEV